MVSGRSFASSVKDMILALLLYQFNGIPEFFVGAASAVLEWPVGRREAHINDDPAKVNRNITDLRTTSGCGYVGAAVREHCDH